MNHFEFIFLYIFILALWLPINQATLEPAKDARSHFAAEFYRRVVVDLHKENENIFVSPGAVQKFLTTIYKGTERHLADRILFNIGIKHIDMQRLIADCLKETGSRDYAFTPHLKRKQLDELAEIIDQQKVIDYFKEDFEDKKDTIKVENFIVVPEDISPVMDFKTFAKNYFNTTIVNAKSAETQQITTKFGDLYKNTENVELYSNIEVRSKIKNSYSLANGNINAVIEAKYYEDANLQYVELPLIDGLNLFIALADKPNEFKYFITQIIGRSVRDFDYYYSKHWQNETVLVHLPSLKLESISDLAVHFRKVAREGLKHSLKSDAKLSEGFKNWPENGVKIDHYWQRVVLEIESEDNTDAVKNAHSKTFNAIGKNFFYAIKSDIDYYVMGHYIGAVEE